MFLFFIYFFKEPGVLAVVKKNNVYGFYVVPLLLLLPILFKAGVLVPVIKHTKKAYQELFWFI